MPNEVGVALDAVGKLGLAVTLVIALWYVILAPRKTHDGKPKSSMLVPGWIHDAKIAETEALRTFYEKMASDREAEHDRRIQEWRGFRDEERAARIDAEADRKAVLIALNELTKDVGLLLELQQPSTRGTGNEGTTRAPSA